MASNRFKRPKFRVVPLKQSKADKEKAKLVEKILESKQTDHEFEKLFPKNIPVENDEGEIFYVNALQYNMMFGTAMAKVKYKIPPIKGDKGD